MSSLAFIMAGLLVLLIALPFVLAPLMYLGFFVSSAFCKTCEKGKGDNIGTPEEIAASPCSGEQCTRTDCRRRRFLVAQAAHVPTTTATS